MICWGINGKYNPGKWLRHIGYSMKKFLFLVGIILAIIPGLHAQADSSAVTQPLDTVTSFRPAWYTDSLPEPKVPITEKAWDFLEEEVIPELFEENEKLKVKVKIPWREDFVIPYFPRGFLPAEPGTPYGPQIAWQRSAIMPGLGQVYNDAGWKVPIFWAGYGVAAFWINYNQSQYKRFQTAFILANDGDPDTFDSELTQRYDTEGLRTARDGFRQARDNGYLYILGWHGLQILEAFVDAHLNDFDVSNDLGLRWSPVVNGNGLGVGLRF